MEEDIPPLFFITLLEGYTFRNLISILRAEATNINFNLTPKSVTISCVNQRQYALIHVDLDADEFKTYHYSAFDASGSPVPSIAVGVSTAEMCKVTKIIKKKDSINLYMRPENNKNLYIETVPAGNGKHSQRASISLVQCIQVDPITFESIHYGRPNVKVSASDFAVTCSKVTSQKCVEATVTGYREGIKVEGVNPNKQVCCIEEFGQCKPPKRIGRIVVGDDDTVSSVTIPITTIKGLSKISNMSPPAGLVKVYMEKEKPLAVNAKVGSYGVFTIYIRNPAHN